MSPLWMAMRRLRNEERGAFAVELAVLVPVILLLFVFIWEAGQLVNAEGRLQSVSREIAREITANGVDTVDDSSGAKFILQQAGYHGCTITTTQSGGGVQDSGAVDRYQTVHVTCPISLLGGITRNVSASATSRQDPFRSGTTGDQQA